jgi:hypothetical protein
MVSQTARALPERYRRAGNIGEGYEIRTTEGRWLRITHALRIYAPANIVTFTFEDRQRFTADPREEVMSRRPAGAK